MGGFFGVASKEDCMLDVFFGVDYHSHLGTRRGGLAAYDKNIGLQREIHNIENSPFRTKFENIFDEMSGTSAIGCISDSDPQPLLISRYSVCLGNILSLLRRNVKKGCTLFRHFLENDAPALISFLPERSLPRKQKRHSRSCALCGAEA